MKERGPTSKALTPAAEWCDWSQLQGRCLRMGASGDGMDWAQWAGTEPVMRQPALDRHVLVRHEGGPKHVHRHGARRRSEFETAATAFTFIPAATMAQWRTIGPIAFSHLYIDPEALSKYIGLGSAEMRDVSPDRLLGRPDPLLDLALDRLLASAEDDGLRRQALVDIILSRLAPLLSEKLASSPEFRMPPLALRRVVDLILENLERPLDLQGLADTAGMSRYHFARAFKRQTGQSPYAFVTVRRLHRAAHLLSSETLPIADIGKLCGFQRASHFSARFKHRFGVSPRAYRDATRH